LISIIKEQNDKEITPTLWCPKGTKDIWLYALEGQDIRYRIGESGYGEAE